MRWEAPTIAKFATDAGFERPDVHTAVAIALAGTGGLDHYDVAAGVPGAGRWKGLWALNVDEWPDYRTADLFTPQTAAQVAYELTKRCAGFGWSAVWRAGTDRHWLDHAVANFAADPYTEHEHEPITLNRAERQLDELAHRLRRHARHG